MTPRTGEMTKFNVTPDNPRVTWRDVLAVFVIFGFCFAVGTLLTGDSALGLLGAVAVVGAIAIWRRRVSVRRDRDRVA